MAKKYYACRTVGNEGIYYGDWNACASIVQTNGRQDYKGLLSKEAADEYMHLYPTGLSNTNLLNAADDPQDLPHAIKQGLLALKGLRSLSDTTLKYREYLRNVFDYNQNQTVDYHGKTEEYALMYLPVNMFKIWVPLKKILAEHCLPVIHSQGNERVPLRVLELGAGPGTSTFGLLAFYSALAVDNPSVQIDINYNIVERETDFEYVFEFLKAAYLQTLPGNLHVMIHRTVQRDAENHMQYCAGMNYDLIIESNMINSNEHHDVGYRDRMVPDIVAALRPGAFAILIEPGTYANIVSLNELLSHRPDSIWAAPMKTYISMDRNTFFLEQRNLQMRNRFADTKHWLSYCILTHPFKEISL